MLRRRDTATTEGFGLLPLVLTGVLAMFALVQAATASAAVTGTTDANTVANTILDGSTGSFTGPVGPTQAGVGDAPLAGFPTAGSSFGVLTSGDAELADDPNDSDSSGVFLDITDPSRGSANDPITLNTTVNAPAGSSCMLVDFKFFSEEFPEFVNSGFNDAFIAELDKTDWNVSLNPDTGVQEIFAPNDFAAGYGDLVSVDDVGPTLVNEANATGSTYDAATATITTKTPITPGAHALYLSVFDAGDGIYDSAVFLDNLQFNSEPPSTCRPADIFAGAVGVSQAQKVINFNGKTGDFDLTCLLPASATDPCIGNVSIAAALPKTDRATFDKKKAKVAKGSYSVEPGTTGAATLKLTRKGKRLLKTTAKAKAKAKVTNSVNGASASFKVKLKG